MTFTHTLSAANSLPDIGEKAVEHDSKAVVTICEAMVKDFRGVFESVTRSRPQNLLAEHDADIKDLSRALVAIGGRVRSKNANDLVTNFSELGIDEDELFLAKELSQALSATAHYLLVVDPHKEKNPETKDALYKAETAQTGAKANIEWLDFFVKLKRRFDYLSNDDMLQIFNSTLGRFELRQVFASRVSESFPVGVFSTLAAYLKLEETMSDQEKSQGFFRAPTVQQDTADSIDLIWESNDTSVDPTKYYEIKSAPESFGFRVVDIMDVTNMDQLKKDIETQIRYERGTNYLDAIEKLRNAVIKQGTSSTKGYIVFVPIGSNDR